MSIYQVSADIDDYRRITSPAYQVCPTICPPVLRAGRHNVGEFEGMGLRFLNVAIPQGTTINAANLIITSSENTNDACGTRISAENVDNPAVFSVDDYAAAHARWVNRTVARVDWDFTPFDVWILNAEYNSPDIAVVIQEIINRLGWVSGNAIAIFWNDWDWRTALNSHRPAYPHNIDANRAVKLDIDWETIPIVQTLPATEIT